MEKNIPADNASAGKIAGKYKHGTTWFTNIAFFGVGAIEKAGAIPDKIAIIGYCFGGTGALEAGKS